MALAADPRQPMTGADPVAAASRDYNFYLDLHQRYSTKLPYNPGNTLRVNVSVVPQ